MPVNVVIPHKLGLEGMEVPEWRDEVEASS